jgi:phosphohistidine phosphatase SixA
VASVLLTGDENAGLLFKKSAVACLVFDGPMQAGGGCLEWLLQPRVLRALAGAPGEEE